MADMQDNSSQTADNNQADNLVELFRAALMKYHAHDWTMETVSEAAHICASTLLTEQAHNNLTFTRHDRVIAELLDKHSRDMAVLGLKNHGYSVTAMQQTEKLTKRLSKYFAEVTGMANISRHSRGNACSNPPKDKQ